jgi:hypothetical protein
MQSYKITLTSILSITIYRLIVKTVTEYLIIQEAMSLGFLLKI